MLRISTDCCQAKLTKNLLVRNKLILVMAISWTAIVTYYSLVSSNEIPTMPMNFDKLGHLAFYFGTTLSWFLYFRSGKAKKSFKKAAITAFLISFFYGILIEVAQGLFTATRQPDVIDVFANTFGAILAIILIYLARFFSKSKNKAQ